MHARVQGDRRRRIKKKKNECSRTGKRDEDEAGGQVPWLSKVPPDECPKRFLSIARGEHFFSFCFLSRGSLTRFLSR